MSEFTNIFGEPCKFHSTLFGWRIYRAWNVPENHGRMLYFAVSPSSRVAVARNLSGIKDRVRGYKDE